MKNKLHDSQEAMIAQTRKQQEHELEYARCFQRVFESKDGEAVMAYLKQITTNQVCTPNGRPDWKDELVFLEGQRSMVGVINMMVEKSKKGLNNEDR